jgi:hypothetical protein
MLLAATRHAVIDFKRFWSGQSAQALSDLREAGLVRFLCGISTPFFSQPFSPPILTSESSV